MAAPNIQQQFPRPQLPACAWALCQAVHSCHCPNSPPWEPARDPLSTSAQPVELATPAPAPAHTAPMMLGSM